MFHQFLRLLFLSAFILSQGMTAFTQCPDTQPKITGPDEVGASSNTVQYKTPSVTGHTYSWVVKQVPSMAVVNTSASSVLNQVWSTPGNYLIELSEGISGNSCTAVAAMPLSVSVKPMLAAYFYYEFDANHGCFFNEVTFTATGDGNYPPQDPLISYEYKWRIYNPQGPWSAILNGNVQSITFPTNAGVTYEVNLKVLKTIAGTVWTDEITDFVYVDPDKYKPVPVLATPTIPNCLTQSFSFSAEGSQPTLMPTSETFLYVDWDFGDGETAHYEKTGNIDPQLTTTHTYSIVGPKTVTVTLTNTIHCVISKSILVDVPNTIPIAGFTAEPACVEFPTVFHDISVPSTGNITKWEWNWGDFNSTIYDLNAIPPTPPPAQIEHAYLTPGLKHVTLQVTNSNGCISDVFSMDVNVIRSPHADFEYNITCVNNPINFLDKSTQNGGSAIVSSEWDYGDGIWTTNSSHTFTALGPQTVRHKVTNADGCANIKVDNSIVIHPIPEFTPDPLVGFTWTNTAMPLEIQFTDNTIPAQVGNNLQWQFGDGNPGFGKNPSHTYTNPGSYNVEMTCTSLNGCTNTYTELISFTPPVPTFHPTPVDACLDKEVRVTPDPVLGTILSQEWWYEDEGYVATDPQLYPPYTVRHVFVPPVVLPAVDTHFFKSYGANKAIRHVITLAGTPPIVVDHIEYVTIHDTAISNFTWNNVNQLPVGGPPLPGCKGQEVFFFDQSTAPIGSTNAQIIKWEWDFDDPASSGSNTATTQNASHTFMDPIRTTFNVKLTVTSSDNNCESFILKAISIKPSPPVNYIVNGNPNANVGCMSTIALPAVVDFAYDPTVIPDPTQILYWSWDFGDGNTQSGSSYSSISHSYLTSGWKTVILTITDLDGCKNSVSKQVYINPPPTASFIYSPNKCEGEGVLFTDQSMPGGGLLNDYIVEWDWYWGDGTLPDPDIHFNNAPIIHTFPIVSGQYTWPVKLRVKTNYGCWNEITIQVTLKASPVAFFVVQPLTPQCVAPQLVQFQDKTVPTLATGPITGHYWDFTDGGNSTLPDPTHAFQNVGSYPVSLTVTTNNGCSNTYVANPPIAINPSPTALFSVTPACEGSSTLFDASASNTQGISDIAVYEWNFGDSFYGNGQTIGHTYNTYGAFIVTLKITNLNGCEATTTQTVFVHPRPIPEFTFSQVNCIGSNVSYYDQSFIPAGFPETIDLWLWDFGDGQPPISYTPATVPNIVTYTFQDNLTIHTVKLVVRTTSGCKDSISHTVNNIPSPIAHFTASQTNCVNQSIHFTNTSSTNGGTAIQTYAWTFGDGFTSVLENPDHTYTTPGPKSVTLTVTNASGCVSPVPASQSIVVNPKPTANFTTDTPCQGNEMTFTDASVPNAGTIVSYFWEFGDLTTSTNAPPVTHTYSAAGNYQVKLTITTDLGCFKDTTKTVEVYGKPYAAFTTSGANCAMDSVAFSAVSSSAAHGYITEYKWHFDDGSADVTKTTPNIKHKFVNGGTYNVKLTITTSDDCTAEKINPVVVKDKPLADFEYPTTRCALMSVQFTDISQSGGSTLTNWTWTFGDPGSGVNNTATVQNPIHIFSTGGNDTIRLIVVNANGCSDTTFKVLQINDAPFAVFSADTACMASPTQFIDESTTPTGTNIVTWNWVFGDPSSPNNTSTLQNPSHIYNTQGTFYVHLLVTNSNQCEKDTTIAISVNPKPTAMFEFSSVCVSDSTSFTDLSIAPGSQIQSWFWDFGDGTGTSTIQNPKYSYSTAGTYNVKLVVMNLSNCKDSIIIPVIARPKPVAKFSYISYYCPAGKVDFQDNSTATAATIAARSWDFGNGNTSNIPNPSFTFPETNVKYLVRLMVTDTYGCMDTISDSIYVKPGFKFTYTFDTVCEGYPTHFTPINQAAGDSLYSLYWNFGDPPSGPGNISHSYSPQHTFSSPGTYVVKMRANNSDNCIDSVFREVLVYAAPKPLFSYVSTPCDSTVHFHDSTTNNGTGYITSWKWIWGDGTPPLVINSPGPGDTSHLYVNAGIYPVTLIMTNVNGCMDSITKNVQRFPCIKAIYSYQDTLLCARYKITFSDSSLPISRITQWHWIWGDGNDTTYTNHTNPVTHTFADSGNYQVSLTINTLINGSPITDEMIQTIRIHPTPYTFFSNVPVCLNQLSLFRDTSKTFGELIKYWKWNFTPKPGDTSIISNPSFKFDTAGYYKVKLTVMNKYGCKDSLIKSTRVYHLPLAKYESSAACIGDPTYFTDLTAFSDTTISSWKWRFGDGTPDLTVLAPKIGDTAHTYTTTGNFTVREMVKDFFGCVDTIDSTIVVNVTPTSAFTLANNYNNKQGQVKLNNLTTGTSTYNWEFPGGIPSTSTEKNPVVRYTEDSPDGEPYIIKLISVNEFKCTDTSFYKYELLFKGLYVPNAFSPTSTTSNLDVLKFQPKGVNLRQYHVSVFDTWGNLIWESTKLDEKGRPSEWWDGTHNGNLMPQGNYMWKITAIFKDGTPWIGNDVGQGAYGTMGNVLLIR
ncbi:MAG: PKD domain-containing protein [Bacteroidales bacterium]|nr:PKD domain-containing protein [Bacteroidales bacterium]